MKDIAVIIQSRDRVDEFITTVDMLYTTCYDQKNFDIIGVIDTDQIELYSKAKSTYPDIIWLYSEHVPNDWTNLIKIQHDFIKNNNYYFGWLVCDDFRGLLNNWDKVITSKKNLFPDNLFTIYNVGLRVGMDPQAENKCYTNDDNIIKDLTKENIQILEEEGRNIYEGCELLPVSTKKWIEFMSPLLLQGKYTSQHDLITASLILILKKQYNIKRLISGVHLTDKLYWNHYENQGTSDTILTEGKDKRESFYGLIHSGYKELQPIAKKIYNEIKKFEKI